MDQMSQPQSTDSDHIVQHIKTTALKANRRVWQTVRFAVAVVFFCTLFIFISAASADMFLSDEANSTKQIPVIATCEGEVWLLCGANAVNLGPNVEYMLPPYSESEHGRIMGFMEPGSTELYYMQDYDRNKGAGTLMRVSADAKSKPETVAGQVYVASFSADGSSALYITDMVDDSGSLWVYQNGKSKRVASEVYNQGFGFSSDGQHLLFHKKTQDQFHLFVFADGRAEEVDAVLSAPAPAVIVDNEGRVYYCKDDSRTLCRYANGQSEEIAKNASLLAVLDDIEGVLYRSGDKLCYKSGDEEEICLYTGEDYIVPVGYVYGVLSSQERYLITLNNWRNEGGITLAEIDFSGKRLIEIAKEIDVYSCVANADSSAVTYRKNGNTYILQNQNGSWGKPVLLCGNRVKLFGFSQVGDDMYWLDDNENELWCYKLDNGIRMLLVEDVDAFVVAGETVYAISKTGEVYRADLGNVVRLRGGAYTPIEKNIEIKRFYENGHGSSMWTENNYTLLTTHDGIYIVTNKREIVYYPNGGIIEKTLLKNAEALLYPIYYLPGYYTMEVLLDPMAYMVLSKEDEKSLKALYKDICFYRDMLEGKEVGTPKGTPEQNCELAQQIAGREHIPPDAANIADWFDRSFSMIGVWLENKDDYQCRVNSLSNVEYATYYYQQYFHIHSI